MSASLAELVASIAALDQYLACSVEREDGRDPAGWIELRATHPVEPAWLDRLAAEYGAHLGLPEDRQSQAAFIVLDATWYATAPLVAALLSEEALPTLAGAGLWLDGTRLGTLALAPVDPRRPATVEELRTEVETHLAPLVEAVANRRWISRRTAWMGVGDRVVGALEHVGELLDRREAAREAAERLVHRPGSALDSPRHRFMEIEHAGVVRAVGLRASCCRYYRVPGAERCLTCPLVPDGERRVRLERWLAAELEEATVASA